MNQCGIVRGNHHRREQPNVVGQTGVQFVVALELLLCAALQPATHTFLHVETLEIALHQHEGLAVGDVLTIDGVEIALTKTEVMHSV